MPERIASVDAFWHIRRSMSRNCKGQAISYMIANSFGVFAGRVNINGSKSTKSIITNG
ncbi:MAG: hypothetical protein WCG95_07895 [bacterium]